ncbi:MAG: hypothetical protein ACT4QE_06535 [Anaerolineales bacterium]
MTEIIFADVAMVSAFGEKVLRFLWSEYDRAEFLVLGFAENVITIADYRKTSVAAIKDSVVNNDQQTFVDKFNQPAFVTIAKADSVAVRISLYDTSITDPRLSLWVAAEMNDALPANEVAYCKAESSSDGSYSLVSVFERELSEAEELTSVVCAG